MFVVQIHVWVNSEHMLEKCLVGTLETSSKRTNKMQTLSVGVPPPIISSAPAELSLPVPTSTTPTTHSQPVNEGALSLQMLRQARIHSKEAVEEDIKIQVPDWIQPLPTQSTNKQLGTSVDPPTLVGYDTAV